MLGRCPIATRSASSRSSKPAATSRAASSPPRTSSSGASGTARSNTSAWSGPPGRRCSSTASRSRPAGMTASADVFRRSACRPHMAAPSRRQEDLQGQRRGHPAQPRVLAVAARRPQRRRRLDHRRERTAAHRRRRSCRRGFTIEGQRRTSTSPTAGRPSGCARRIGRGISHAVARLRDGVTLEQAVDEMKALAAQREKEAPRAECRAIGQRHADPRAHDRDDQAGAAGPLRRRRPRAADRVRQRRQPAARAQHRPAA